MNDYQKFQNILTWFVRQLKINNDIIIGEHISGQGYKGQKIRNSYTQWREYSNGDKIDISLQLGHAKDKVSNYLHWTETWVNIVPVFVKNEDDKSDLIELRVIDKKDNIERKEYAKKSIKELGLESNTNTFHAPNDKLISFFNSFKEALREYNVDEGITIPEEVDSRNDLPEGAKKTVMVNSFERNPAARKKCIKYYGSICKICGFDFGKEYGQSFEGKIQVHHIKPISQMNGEYSIDPIMDLIPVCPNCHFVLHSKKDGVYEINEVRDMLKTQYYSQRIPTTQYSRTNI